MLRVRNSAKRDFVNQAIKHQLGWWPCIFNTGGISNSLMEHKLDTNTCEIFKGQKMATESSVIRALFRRGLTLNNIYKILFSFFMSEKYSKNIFVGKAQYLACTRRKTTS